MPTAAEPTLEAKVQELWDIRAIESLLNRYSRAFDRCDLAGAQDTFWPDALTDYPGFCGLASGMCVHADTIHREQFDSTQHYITNNEIEISGDAAHSETYFIMAARLKDAFDALLIGGRYLRRIERRDGVWRIASTVTVVDWSSDKNAARQVIESGSKSARDKSDFVYQRPLEITRTAVEQEMALNRHA